MLSCIQEFQKEASGWKELPPDAKYACCGCAIWSCGSTSSTKEKIQPIGSIKGFVLNFGLSGGMNPSGDVIATNTWWCAASYLQSLGAQWGFTPGCRRPASVDIQLLLPDFPFIVDGHASTGFDSIALWYTPALSGAIQWLPQVSTTMRTCWVSLCDAEVWSCVYIPPSSSGVSREQVVATYFEEWDAIKARLQRQCRGNDSSPLIRGCGDLNMQDDIRDTFESAMRSRDLVWVSDPEKGTHIKGGVLDYVWAERSATVPGLTLHDGSACRSSGCENPACGDLGSLLGSQDLDHFPFTFNALMRRHAPSPSFKERFVKDLDAWTIAVCVLIDPLFHDLHLDISSACQCPASWKIAGTRVCRRFLNTAAAVWETLLTLVGYASGLVLLRPLDRKPQAPPPVREAFQNLLQACSEHAKLPSSLITLTQVEIKRSEFRRVVSSHKRVLHDCRLRTYVDLCQRQSSSAESFLARCLRRPSLGLPDYMVSANDLVITGPDLLEGACEYIRGFQRVPETADPVHRVKADAALDALRCRMREQHWAQICVPDFITDESLERACGCIDVRAECRGLPYAALLAEAPHMRALVLALHSFAFMLGMVPRLWTTQDLYHARKPKRDPQAFSSYRILGLNSAQGRLLEELWMQSEPHLWQHVGALQEGRSESLIVVASDLAASSLRKSLRLPFGLVFTDRREAFDTQWRTPILENLQQVISCPASWLIADELLQSTRMSIVKGGSRSACFSIGVGTIEGRKLSPLQFCIAQANLGKLADARMTGIGLNPPMEAVSAFHAFADGSADGYYDTDSATMLYSMVCDALMSWPQAMRSAPNDSVRLLLLDMASSIRRGLRSFVDDTRVPVASLGHATAAIQVLSEAASTDQYVYKAGKNCILAHAFPKMKPLMLQGSSVEFVDSHIQLGVSLGAPPVHPCSWRYENAHPDGRAFFGRISHACASLSRAYKNAAFSGPCN